MVRTERSVDDSVAGGGELVVVTGGAGFIGSHLVDRLVAAGHQVVILDNFSTGKYENLAQWRDDPRVAVIECNVADGVFAPLSEATRRRGPVARIVHLAAQVSVTNSIANPLDDIRTNYIGTAQVLEYARHCGVKKVVFSSSAAVYGDVATFPVHEGLSCAPMSPYGINKRSAELLLSCYSKVHGVPTDVFRFFNVYGPRQDPRSPYSGVISIFAERAVTNRPLTIFGDGEQTRDFIFVGDICRALMSAVLSDSGDGAPVNLGTGTEISVRQLAADIVALCESSSPIVHAPARAGEISRSVAAVELARERRGFIASVALVDGLRATLSWLEG